jgi:outer membrane protein, multidrug efflux system
VSKISLSGASGFQSSAVSNLFSGPAGAWSFGASLTQPIFTGSRLRSQVRLAEARERTAVLFYQQSIQGTFRSVSDALVAYHKTREFRAQQELLFGSAEDAARLSHMRYNGGVTGYLEVLTTASPPTKPIRSRRSSASCRHGSRNCWLLSSSTKRWEGAGSNSAL